MDLKMNTFIALAGVACFSFSMLAGVSIRTLAELENYRSHSMEARLVAMPLKDLAQEKII